MHDDIDDPPYWWDYYKGEMYMVVSRDDGGVIAYAIGLDHATEIVSALNKAYAIDHPDPTQPPDTYVDID